MVRLCRCLFAVFCLGIFLVPFTFAQESNITCRELLKNESDLDKVYDLSDMVFIAEIDPREGVNQQIYNYRVFEPVLKGVIPQEGIVTFAHGCEPRTRTAIYIFFLDSLKEKIAGFNAIFFSLPDGGPGYTWIADWVEEKIGGNMKSEDRSQDLEGGR